MNKIKKILAPTDLSEWSKRGVRCAMELAVHQSAEVLVYYVVDVAEESRREELVPSREFVDNRKKELARFVETNFADLCSKVAMRQEVELGRAYTNIVEKAANENADLIVMSTHGRTGLAHMLMGSVTEKVVGRAACPVLSVPPPRAEAPLTKSEGATINA